MGKTIGMVMIGGAIAAFVLVALVMFVFNQDSGLSNSGAVLGFALFTLVLVLPLAGAGIFFLRKGGAEEAILADVRQERKLLNMVKTQGQVEISDAVFELNSTRDQVHQMLYSLVGKGLFSGYIDWDDGTLFSEQASQLRDLEACRNCGGQLDLAGKGVIKCPFCGTEYFL